MTWNQGHSTDKHKDAAAFREYTKTMQQINEVNNATSERINEIHSMFHQYTYQQVLDACREISARYPVSSRVTLAKIIIDYPGIIEEFKEIIGEQKEHELS